MLYHDRHISFDVLIVYLNKQWLSINLVFLVDRRGLKIHSVVLSLKLGYTLTNQGFC